MLICLKFVSGLFGNPEMRIQALDKRTRKVRRVASNL